MITKAFIANCFRQISLPASMLKTFLLQSISRPYSHSYKSASDDGKYPYAALLAAIDLKRFSVFRRHHNYSHILEHVSARRGHEYLEILTEEYGLSPLDVMALIRPLQHIGSPRLKWVKGLPSPVSTTALRYLKVALEIKDLFANNSSNSLGHVVEIGCGYGGQALILDKVVKIDSYTFIDLWQVNLLIRRFIEDSEFSCQYTTSTLREHKWDRSSFDLVISNYAYSELPIALQLKFMEKIISKARRGYMTMNSGKDGGYGEIKNMSQAQLMTYIPNCIFKEEKPLTKPQAYVAQWNNSVQL